MGTATYKLKLYTPHSAQLEFHNAIKRFRVCAWGRQAGKSTGSLNDILRKAWENPGSTNWFISPTYDQAKVQYRRLVGMLWPIAQVMLKKNQSELRVKLLNQSQIVFKSGNNFEALRGETLNGCVIDEMREQDPLLWPMVIRPMLATTKGWCVFISTTNGFDSFYDLAVTAQNDDSGEWFFMKAPSSANPLITESEIASMRKNMNDKQFLQEVMAEFVDLNAGKAYYNFHSANVVDQNPFSKPDEEWSPHLPIAVAMDFNVNPMCWTLGQEKVKKFYWGDEITLADSNTPEAAKHLADKVKFHKPGVVIIGDSAGKSRSTKSTGESDYDLIALELKRHGVKFEMQTPDSAPGIKDRINTVNNLLKDGQGNISCHINRKCKTLIKDLERVTLREGSSGTFALDKRKDASLTHASDGVGYYMYARAAVLYDPRPSGMKVLYRF